MRVFQTEDGYKFYEQEDGTFTDTEDASAADLVYASLRDLKAAVDVDEITEGQQ